MSIEDVGLPASEMPHSDWSRREIDLVVAAYFEMWAKQFKGEAFRKIDVVRQLQTLLPARTARSIEAKFQNVSAILAENGIGWIEGYKPYHNYQRALREAVLGWLSGPSAIRETMEAYESSALPAPTPVRLATEDVVVPPPSGLTARTRTRTAVTLTGGEDAALRDFQRRSLGDAGERWVLDLERESLERAGRGDLAGRVDWVAKSRGDGLGFDILSYRPDGRELLIEVKTTNLGPRTPFYITQWEVDVSKRRAPDYSLYRVHGFARDARVYVLQGDVEQQARLEPRVFLGIPA